MEENEEAAHLAKIMYFSNQIIYKSKVNEKQMRVSNNFLEYLKYAVADDITYDHDDGYGAFIISQSKNLKGDSKGPQKYSLKLDLTQKMRHKKNMEK
jgi:hypothetical protein